MKPNLVPGIFSRFGARRVPTPETLTHLMVQAAQLEFLIKPHAPFWQSKSVYELFSLFSAHSCQGNGDATGQCLVIPVKLMYLDTFSSILET